MMRERTSPAISLPRILLFLPITNTSQLIKEMLICYWDPAGWQLEPITDATPNQWAAGLVGTNRGSWSAGYVIGGLGEGSSVLNPDLQMYDPTLGSVTQLADIPNPRFSPVTAWIGGLIYAAGGYDTAFASTNDLQVYDPVTNLWDNTAPPDMPNTRGGAGGVATCSSGVGDCLFHVGGGLDSNFANTTLETWNFNPSLGVSGLSWITNRLVLRLMDSSLGQALVVAARSTSGVIIAAITILFRIYLTNRLTVVRAACYSSIRRSDDPSHGL